MIADLWDGLISYFKVLPYIRRFGLGIYMLITGLISLLIGAGIIFSAIRISPTFGDWLVSFYSWEWGSAFFAGLADWISGIAIVLFSLLIYKYLILILVAPFMSLVSEKIENSLNPGVNPGIHFSVKRAIREMIRGIRISIRNIVRELAFTLLFIVAGLFPPLAVIAGPAILLIQAFYAGFGNMDYFLERHCSIGESVRFVNQYRGLAVANGAVYLFLLVIPVIGLIVAPTLGAAAATVESLKRMNHVSHLNL